MDEGGEERTNYTNLPPHLSALGGGGGNETVLAFPRQGDMPRAQPTPGISSNTPPHPHPSEALLKTLHLELPEQYVVELELHTARAASNRGNKNKREGKIGQGVRLIG